MDGKNSFNLNLIGPDNKKNDNIWLIFDLDHNQVVRFGVSNIFVYI